MAQSLKSKIRKLSEQFNIAAIISTAEEIARDQEDSDAWDRLTADEKTAWFMDQCALYGLTVTNHALNPTKYNNRLIVEEFRGPNSHKVPYFTVFLPCTSSWRGTGDSAWHLEIGSAYAHSCGTIWPTHPGLEGKAQQIAEVMRLRRLQGL
ncbi:hypothetical protein UFOVP700_7 [uncultured Caudovirales phage]|uniref:Uncharacterized protein n=1 Tax=uncultured Caudovirales phage TaxID=2100421 RepID=A0A6J5NGK9_9CAUD|nr:hypothetical protein UFOVP700_7 [uncultured Caudovirales phage]